MDVAVYRFHTAPTAVTRGMRRSVVARCGACDTLVTDFGGDAVGGFVSADGASNVAHTFALDAAVPTWQRLGDTLSGFATSTSGTARCAGVAGIGR
jgi:hypothetical protein